MAALVAALFVGQMSRFASRKNALVLGSVPGHSSWGLTALRGSTLDSACALALS